MPLQTVDYGERVDTEFSGELTIRWFQANNMGELGFIVHAKGPEDQLLASAKAPKLMDAIEAVLTKVIEQGRPSRHGWYLGKSTRDESRSDLYDEGRLLGFIQGHYRTWKVFRTTLLDPEQIGRVTTEKTDAMRFLEEQTSFAKRHLAHTSQD